VNVNHLNNTYAPEPPEYNSTTNIAPPGTVFPQERKDDWSIKWLVLYDRNGRAPFFSSWPGTTFTVSINQTRVPRRLWGIVNPCFFYLYILETSLNHLGYKVKFDFANNSDEEFFKQIVVLNNHNIYQTIIGREEGYYDYVNGTPDPGYFSRSNILSVANILEIEGKNHVPDISVLDLLIDFKAKSNFNLEIEGDTLVFKSIQIKQSEVKQVFDPNISTSQVEILSDKILKYNYNEADYIENIPDYRINLGNKNADEISSDLVPVYIRREDQLNPTNKWHYPYIVGAPSFDESTKSFITYVVDEAVLDFSSSSNNHFFQGTVPYLNYPVEFPELGIDTENLPSYVIKPCPLFCALTQYRDAYYPVIGINPLFHLYYISGIPSQIFGYVCIADQHLSTPTDIIRTLRWETEEGIFETMYLRTIDILKAKFVVKLKAAMTIEAWNKFSHYHFFSLTGKKLFPFLREYTLPFSKNNQVKMDCYEVE
jgi:hypothetical protein